jgi:polynucleotide 5'-kinase involved in rRNA processing
VELKRRKIERLRPTVILAIQREGELEPILQAADPGRTRIERLAPAPEVARRSLEERAGYRDRAFARYFINARTHQVPLAHAPATGLGPDWPSGTVEPIDSAALADRVVALRDAAGRDLALGFVRDVSAAGGVLSISTPLAGIADIRGIGVGSFRWPARPAEAYVIDSTERKLEGT